MQIFKPIKIFFSKNVGLSFLLGLAVVLVYWPLGGHDWIHYDDGFYIFKNPMVAKGLSMEGVKWAFTTLSRGNWHPITWLSHMLDVELFGLDPGAFLWMNAALHA